MILRRRFNNELPKPKPIAPKPECLSYWLESRDNSKVFYFGERGTDVEYTSTAYDNWLVINKGNNLNLEMYLPRSTSYPIFWNYGLKGISLLRKNESTEFPSPAIMVMSNDPNYDLTDLFKKNFTVSIVVATKDNQTNNDEYPYFQAYSDSSNRVSISQRNFTLKTEFVSRGAIRGIAESNTPSTGYDIAIISYDYDSKTIKTIKKNGVDVVTESVNRLDVFNSINKMELLVSSLSYGGTYVTGDLALVDFRFYECEFLDAEMIQLHLVLTDQINTIS